MGWIAGSDILDLDPVWSRLTGNSYCGLDD
jgi:hypothetical protein